MQSTPPQERQYRLDIVLRPSDSGQHAVLAITRENYASAFPLDNNLLFERVQEIVNNELRTICRSLSEDLRQLRQQHNKER